MLFGKDIGIDLGTTTVLVSVKGRGIVLREPTVVAMDKNTGRMLKVGMAAQRMLGRTPGNIVAIRPLREGVISDYDMTERMLKELIRKVASFSLLKPRLVISVPSGITEVEERAVIDASIQAGARKVYLIEDLSPRRWGPVSTSQSRRGTWLWTSAAERPMWPLFRCPASSSHLP